MDWTRQDKIRYVVGLPWTVSVSRDLDGDVVAEVAELPFVTAVGKTEKAAARDLFLALSTAIDALLEHGDPIPLPHGVALPWTLGQEPPKTARPAVIEGHLGGDAWMASVTSVAQSFAVSGAG